MKRLIRKITVFTGISTIGLTATFAQPFHVTVDELGNGNVNGFLPPLSSGMRADPFSGMVTLAYQTTLSTSPGDVQLYETVAGGPPVISDLIRFDGQGFLYFFSDLEPGELNPDPADVAQFPAPLTQFPIVQLVENGPEGNNGATYTPASGQPGFNSLYPSGTVNSFTFISDVPEPGPGALALLSGALLMVSRSWRRAW